MHFDDDALPVERDDPGAAARSAALNADPERQSLAVLEFDALARHLAAKGIAFGQTERAFVVSMAQYYRMGREAFEATLKIQRGQTPAGAADPPPTETPPAPPDGAAG